MTKIRTRTSGAHKGKRYPIENKGPQGYSIAKGNPTSKGVTRAELRASKLVKSRYPRIQREYEARNVIIKSPPMSGVMDDTVTFTRDKPGGPNPMSPVVRRVDKGKEWDQKRDLARLNKRVLDPTNPTHQAMWMDHPERYDMADVDTPFRDDDIITLFRGVKGQKAYKSGDPKSGYYKTIGDYNKLEAGLGQYWTGNIQVARLYATRGTVTITDGPTLANMDFMTGEMIKKKMPTSSYPGYEGVLFKYDATGREIDIYNPEGLPHEMEARQPAIKFEWERRDQPLAKKYPGIEIGFIKGKTGRSVEWHKITKKMEATSILEISKQKPTRVSHIEPVKEIQKEITYTPKYATKPKTVRVHKVSAKSEGKVEVAKEPSIVTEKILEKKKKGRE